jgi:hypothetical protein
MNGNAAPHDRIVKATATVARIEVDVPDVLTEADVFMKAPGSGIRMNFRLPDCVRRRHA